MAGILAGGMVAGSAAVLTPEQTAAAVQLDAVTIPTPGEFFAAIDKVGRPNWTQAGRSQVNASASNRPQIALNLGSLVADGYLSVEAHDSQGVKNIGRDIVQLAKKLNVSESVLARGNSINDFAENNDWNALKEELEATQNEVKLTLRDQKDDDLVILVSLGAWLRGIQASTELIARNFSPASSKLFRQPAVAEYLILQVDALPERIRNDELVAKVRGQLGQVKEIISVPADQQLSGEQISALNHAVAIAIEQISGQPVKLPEPAPTPTP